MPEPDVSQIRWGGQLVEKRANAAIYPHYREDLIHGRRLARQRVGL